MNRLSLASLPVPAPLGVPMAPSASALASTDTVLVAVFRIGGAATVAFAVAYVIWQLLSRRRIRLSGIRSAGRTAIRMHAVLIVLPTFTALVGVLGTVAAWGTHEAPQLAAAIRTLWP